MIQSTGRSRELKRRRPSGAARTSERLAHVAVMSEPRGLLRLALGFRPGAPVARHQEQFACRGPDPDAVVQQAVLEVHHGPRRGLLAEVPFVHPIEAAFLGSA